MENNFKLIAELSDKDFFPEYKGEILTSVNRKCVRAIIFDEDNNIALVRAKTLLVPGGGVEVGETLEDALKRECLEEVGCEVDDIKPFAKTTESRMQMKGVQETYCFIAKLAGNKGKPTTIQHDEAGMEVFWYPLEIALNKLKHQQSIIHPKSYNTHFNVATHILFLEELMNKNSL